jgi:hypothetical protein
VGRVIVRNVALFPCMAAKALPSYVVPKVAASAVRLVRKRKVLVLNSQSRPKRPQNGLYQGHTARTSVGNSTSKVVRHPGSISRPYAHLFTKTLIYPFCLIWRLDSGVALTACACLTATPRVHARRVRRAGGCTAVRRRVPSWARNATDPWGERDASGAGELARADGDAAV